MNPVGDSGGMDLFYAPDSTRKPEIDLSRCVVCLGCEEICPEVFRLNPAGYLEVIEMDEYPAELVDQAIAICPKDCLYWIE